MLRCKEIVRLLSEEEKIPFLRRAEVKMHLMMCQHCSAYSKHLNFMKIGFKKLFTRLTRIEPNTIGELEKKVIEKLKKSSPKQESD